MSLESYEAYLKLQKKQPLTIRNYIQNLRIVERFLGKHLDKSITREDIESFLNSIANNSANTIKMRMISLKIYFKWLYKTKDYPEIVDFKLPKPKMNGLVSSDLLTEEEILKLINACDSLRDKSIIALMYDSACRIGEIANLNIENVVVESDKTGYIVVDGKTGKRQVPLSFSIPSLREWLNCHPQKSNPKSPLFISNRLGKRMIEEAFRYQLFKYAKRIELNKKIFCHLFRHSRLTDLDKKGLSHTAMKNFAGWSRNSNMPSIYSHFSAQDTKELVYEVDGIAQPKIRKKTILEPVNCPKCDTPNDKTNKFCFLCGMALDDNSRKEFEIEEVVKELIKTDPELNKMLFDKIKGITIKTVR